MTAENMIYSSDCCCN